LIENRKPKFFYGYIVVVAAFCVMVVAGGVSVIFGVFFEPMLTEFGWTRAMFSGATSLRIFITTLLGIVGGRLTDKFGPRPVATASGLFLGLSFFLMSRISTIWQLYLVFGVITGAGMSGLFVPHDFYGSEVVCEEAGNDDRHSSFGREFGSDNYATTS